MKQFERVSSRYGAPMGRGRWEVTLAGWNTVTTRSRLSAIVRHVSRLGPDGLGVSSRKGQPYLHDYAGKRPIDCWGWHLVTA